MSLRKKKLEGKKVPVLRGYGTSRRGKNIRKG
jgi:hypothetical protein